jgi:glycogen operon protein
VRRFWKGEGATVGELATRLSGSSDLYLHNGRRPHASLNFVTCHDGFTLADLVSFNTKHNEANQDSNTDGTDQNDSWNCGVEGPSADPVIRTLRLRQQKNFLCSLFLSQGVPMLMAGDEFCRTQGGNNNAYCQDSPLSWLDWNLDEDRRAQLNFVRRLIDLRRTQPVFRRRHFFQGRAIHGTDIKDLYWIRADGMEMCELDWNSPHVRCLGMGLLGDQIVECDERGQPVRGDSFLILMNAGDEAVPFCLGARQREVDWTLVLDTSDGENSMQEDTFPHMAEYPLQSRSVAVLQPHYVPFA